MFWIHGGGLLTGSGSDPFQWGDPLASKRDVVVVSINYRLGAMGFLSHPDFSTGDPEICLLHRKPECRNKYCYNGIPCQPWDCVDIPINPMDYRFSGRNPF